MTELSWSWKPEIIRKRIKKMEAREKDTTLSPLQRYAATATKKKWQARLIEAERWINQNKSGE